MEGRCLLGLGPGQGGEANEDVRTRDDPGISMAWGHVAVLEPTWSPPGTYLAAAPLLSRVLSHGWFTKEALPRLLCEDDCSRSRERLWLAFCCYFSVFQAMAGAHLQELSVGPYQQAGPQALGIQKRIYFSSLHRNIYRDTHALGFPKGIGTNHKLESIDSDFSSEQMENAREAGNAFLPLGKHITVTCVSCLL